MSAKVTKVVNVMGLWKKANQAAQLGHESIQVDTGELLAACEHLHAAWEKVSYLESLIIRIGRA